MVLFRGDLLCDEFKWRSGGKLLMNFVFVTCDLIVKAMVSL